MKSSLAMLSLSLISCSPPPVEASDIQVSDAWARPTAGRKTTTAAYLTIANRGSADDALLAVTTSSGSADVHSTSMAGGIMRMRQLDRVDLPAGATVKLEPGGTHVMLTGLRQPLEPGSRIELALRFEKSAERQVAAQVRDSSGEQM